MTTTTDTTATDTTTAPRFTYAAAAVNGTVYYAACEAGETVADALALARAGEFRPVRIAVKARTGNKVHVASLGGRAWCNQNMRIGGALGASVLRHANPAHFCDKCYTPTSAQMMIDAAQA